MACRLLLWQGWGNFPTSWKRCPHWVTQGDRTYHLFACPLTEVPFLSAYFSLPFPVLEEGLPVASAHLWASAEVRSPNHSWPTDRSWFVATEVDYDSTIVGGSRRLISELLTDPTLEAFPICLDDSLQSDSDRQNPPVRAN